jgi:Type I phosphodiesterase / nucleotide pyrophosphatase
MIDEQSLATIRREQQRGPWTFPDYGRYSLAEIVPTILRVYGVDTARAPLPAHVYERAAAGCDHVVLLVIDGLGYDQVVADGDARPPLFRRLIERAQVHALTSVFPSTTAAALTTLHTGLTPLEHGLLEWTLYFEEFDALIETLPFKPLGSRTNDSLLRRGGRPELLYTGPTLYEQLARAGVTSYCFIPQPYAHSAYSCRVYRGACMRPYGGGADLAVGLRNALRDTSERAFFTVYWPQVDAVGHRFGPSSEEQLVELSILSHLFEAEVLRSLARRGGERTLLLLVADHGQLPVAPTAITYLNDYPAVNRGFARGRRGGRILPGGSPRDVFLHLAPERQARVVEVLRERLAGQAEIVDLDEVLARGLFGRGEPHPSLRGRVGNTVVLPYAHHHVWYRHRPGRLFELRGHHGGLTEREMLVPLVVGRLDEVAG